MNKRVGRHHIRPLCPVVKGFKLCYRSNEFHSKKKNFLHIILGDRLSLVQVQISYLYGIYGTLWYILYIDGLVMAWTLLLHREKAVKTQETTINVCQREQL